MNKVTVSLRESIIISIHLVFPYSIDGENLWTTHKIGKAQLNALGFAVGLILK